MYLPNPKHYTQLIAEGVQRQGGLAPLAPAENMYNPPPSIAALERPLPKVRLLLWSN